MVAKRFNSRMGKCSEQELDMFVKQVSGQVRILPDGPGDGFPPMHPIQKKQAIVISAWQIDRKENPRSDKKYCPELTSR